MNSVWVAITNNEIPPAGRQMSIGEVRLFTFRYQGLDYRTILFLYSYPQCCFCKTTLIVLLNHY